MRTRHKTHKNIRQTIVVFIFLSIIGYSTILSAQDYVNYCNKRFGFCLNYPSHLMKESPPANGDGRVFFDSDGLRITVSGINNVLGDTLEIEMRSQSQDLDKVTYKAKGKNWFVLSGYKGKNIIYLKTFLGTGSINHLYIEYPTYLKKKYDDIAAKISSSFKQGNLE